MSILYLLTGLLLGSLIPWTGDRMLLLAARPVPSQSNALLRRRFALAAGLLFALAWLRYGTTWQSILVCLACTFFLLLAVIDLKARLVLNVLVYPAVLIALLLQWLLPGGHLAGALIGGFFGLGLFWAGGSAETGRAGHGRRQAGRVGWPEHRLSPRPLGLAVDRLRRRCGRTDSTPFSRLERQKRHPLRPIPLLWRDNRPSFRSYPVTAGPLISSP